MKDRNDLTGIILSGGKSARMGKNKAFIEIEGTPIVNRIHSLFKDLFKEIIIVTNEKELFANVDARIYIDIFPNRGVLGGLYTGLFFSSFEHSFCVACDMPFLKRSVIEFLISERSNFDVIVPRTKDGLEPLHAIYSKRCLEPIRKLLEQGRSKVIDLYPMVKVKTIEEHEFFAMDPKKESFINVNTPEDLLSLKKKSSLPK
jgi:molybdopterin-guanine dinucleotide biosynthesis protein A